MGFSGHVRGAITCHHLLAQRRWGAGGLLPPSWDVVALAARTAWHAWDWIALSCIVHCTRPVLVRRGTGGWPPLYVIIQFIQLSAGGGDLMQLA
jgi:hypothetical protein